MKKGSLKTLTESKIKFLFCTLFLILVFCTQARAQEKKVAGVVTSAADNSPMAGVNVVIKGTTTGTTTDANGNFSISVNGDNPVLVFSFIGFNAQEISVGNQSVLNVAMVTSALQLDEVVVTSLGIKKEKKGLSYSAQTVATDGLTQIRDLNVANALSGKVAGIEVIKSNSGVGSPTRVVLRGNRSMIGNNQPLYVVDGAPIVNSTLSTPEGEGGGIAWGDGIGNINPDDIETITVLKGASATALYGSRANNGAIIITTKKGSVTNGIGVEYSFNYSIETPVILTRMQNVYGQGSEGIYFKNSEFDWGPKMEGQMVDHWTPDPNSPYFGTKYPFVGHPDNLKDFFQPGTNMNNAIAFNTGKENFQGYFSYTNSQSKGIIPGNELQRHNFNFRLTGNLSKKLSLDTKITYFMQDVKNRVSTGDDFANPMRSIYRQPSNISLEQARNFEYYNDEGKLLQNYWNPYSNGGENPFWIINRIPEQDSRDRITTLSSVKYEFIPGLSLQIRAAIDFYYDNINQSRYNDTYTIADFGNYMITQHYNKEINTDFLLNYNRKISSDFSLNVSAGGNMLTQKWYYLSTNNGNLLIPNLFTVTNSSTLAAGEDGWTKKLHSLFGFATLGFRNYLFLDITGRNDWSSTLPKENWSYFYPSAGLTLILSEIFKSRPDWIQFAKIRASLAQVGNDTDPYRLDPVFNILPGGANGYAYRSSISPNSDLKAELTTAREFGGDIRFLKNRIGLDFTWYKTNSRNQVLSVYVPVASGYTQKFINGGNLQNTGMEAILNIRPVENKFKWDIAFNFATNKSLVVELTKGVKEYLLSYDRWMTHIIVVEGHEYVDIFTKGLLRNEEGRVLINSNGLPIASDGMTIPMGNYNPDWLGGIRNTFSYKGFDFSFLIDIRMGGDVFSFTEANLASDGMADYTLEGRDGMVVSGIIQTKDEEGNVISERENDIEVTSEAYWQSLGGRNTPTGELFKYDASNIRIREAALSYTKSLNNRVLKNIRVSIVGSNLYFIMNKARIMDPNLMLGTSNYQGVEGFGLPGTRSIGMNLKVTF